MIKIDITIPLFYNDGKPIEQTKLNKVKRELLRQFRGLSISNDSDGYWLNGDKEYNDINRIYTIITGDTVEARSWITGYKSWLEHNLEQHDIFIVISKCEVI